MKPLPREMTQQMPTERLRSGVEQVPYPTLERLAETSSLDGASVDDADFDSPMVDVPKDDSIALESNLCHDAGSTADARTESLESDITDGDQSVAFRQAIDAKGGEDEMMRWLQHQALCIIGGRWWQRDTESIAATLIEEMSPEDLEMHLLTEPDTMLFAEFIARAREAPIVDYSAGECPEENDAEDGDVVEGYQRDDFDVGAEEGAAEVPEGAEAIGFATRPSLAEYAKKWTEEEARHAREVPGEYSRTNLIPRPYPQL